MKLKKLDKHGHSCLVDNRGSAQWDPSADCDVDIEFGRKVAGDFVDKGYLLVDERTSKLLSPRSLRPDTEAVLMPPIIGG